MTEVLGVLSTYTLLEELGRGGFARVYRAHDSRLDRDVALKILLGDAGADEDFKALFEQEAKSAARLRHPNIVVVYDFGEADDRIFIAMDLLSGRDVRKRIRDEGPFDPTRVASIVEQIASALDFAHAEGTIHRDVKPANIIVNDKGHATLTDFGLARAVAGSVSLSRRFVGSVEYMSPEQLDMAGSIDGRADIYSLGISAYEMLTARVPFMGDNPVSVGIAHLTKPPPPPSQFRSGLPQGVETVVLKALSKKPDERYQTAREFAAALRDVVEWGRRIERDLVEEESPTKTMAETAKAPNDAVAEVELQARHGFGQQKPLATSGEDAEKSWAQQASKRFGASSPATRAPIWAQARELLTEWLLPVLFALVIVIIGVAYFDRVQRGLQRAFTAASVARATPTSSHQLGATSATATTPTPNVGPSSAATPLPSPTSGLSISVPGNSDWVNSGVNVQRGQTLRITYLSGYWSPWQDYNLDGRGCLDAKSCPAWGFQDNVIAFYHAGLIGRVGGGLPFAVGNGVSVIASDTGPVFLRINDRVLGDNSGFLNVRVEEIRSE
ncbi:MAG: serine/threonine protein kinase [Chloroflexi bacterium]|nr:serine/threonine protein kinase [Chloroflexota bacterium]